MNLHSEYKHISFHLKTSKLQLFTPSQSERRIAVDIHQYSNLPNLPAVHHINFVVHNGKGYVYIHEENTMTCRIFHGNYWVKVMHNHAVLCKTMCIYNLSTVLWMHLCAQYNASKFMCNVRPVITINVLHIKMLILTYTKTF